MQKNFLLDILLEWQTNNVLSCLPGETLQYGVVFQLGSYW